jgi:hypothetical protein
VKIKIKSTGKAKAGREKKVALKLTNKRIRQGNKLVSNNQNINPDTEIDGNKYCGWYWD